MFRILPVLACVLFTLVNSGCKENIFINSQVSPADDSIGVYDTALDVITHTYYNDTVATSTQIGGFNVYQAIGAFAHPYFGTTVAGTYFNVVPADYTALDPTLIDSAMLYIPYSGLTYGDSLDKTITQTYQVFYLLDTLGGNTSYYPYSTKPLDLANPLSAPTVVNTYHIKDSFGVNVLPQNGAALRIKLNVAALNNRLLPALTAAIDANNSAETFVNNFKGICVQVADTRQTKASMPYFRLDGSDGAYSQASIIVYSHKAGQADTTIQSLFFFDVSNSNIAHFNSITRSYSRSPVNSLVTSTAANDPVIAIQNTPGFNLDIVIPNITKLPQGVINKAELQLTLLPGYKIRSATGDSIQYPLPNMYPVGVASANYPTGIGAGLLYNIADRYPLTSSTPFTVIDGSLHNMVRNGVPVQTYTIGIPREVMSSIMAKNDTIHIRLDGSIDFYGAFDAILGGGNYPDPTYKARLFVVYSKLNN